MGRESKLTPAVQKRITTSIRQGNYDYVAAGAAGIDVSTFTRWMQRGEDKGEENAPEDEPYRAFRTEVEKAETEAEAILVARWSRHAVTDWRAARDLLARRHPERWKSTERREHTGADGGPIGLAVLDDIMEGEEEE